MTDARPRIAVVVFPGSNDERDAALAFEALGAERANRSFKPTSIRERVRCHGS